MQNGLSGARVAVEGHRSGRIQGILKSEILMGSVWEGRRGLRRTPGGETLQLESVKLTEKEGKPMKSCSGLENSRELKARVVLKCLPSCLIYVRAVPVPLHLSS